MFVRLPAVDSNTMYRPSPLMSGLKLSPLAGRPPAPGVSSVTAFSENIEHVDVTRPVPVRGREAGSGRKNDVSTVSADATRRRIMNVRERIPLRNDAERRPR